MKRRTPSQERGERRVNELLQAAATVLADKGYEGATMTEIARAANASIGAVYQYFPNKEELARALRRRYSEELRERWLAADEVLPKLAIPEMAEYILNLMADFAEQYPAFNVLLDAPIAWTRNEQARQRLRQQMARVLQSKKPIMPDDEAYRVANVTMQIVKGMSHLFGQSKGKERQALLSEYRRVLVSYLSQRLS